MREDFPSNHVPSSMYTSHSDCSQSRNSSTSSLCSDCRRQRPKIVVTADNNNRHHRRHHHHHVSDRQKRDLKSFDGHSATNSGTFGQMAGQQQHRDREYTRECRADEAQDYYFRTGELTIPRKMTPSYTKRYCGCC